MAELERTGIDISAVITPFGIKTLDDMTVAGFMSTMNRFAKTKDKA